MDQYLAFKNKIELRKWFSENHDISKGIWIVYFKKEKTETIKYIESLEEALCFGWIDSLIKKIDEEKYARKFTPRRNDSPWSEKNKLIVNRLIKENRMTKWGLEVIKKARKSGTWNKEKKIVVNDDQITNFMHKLIPFEKAYQNFSIMSESSRKRYVAYFIDAKTDETKKKRFEKIIRYIEEKKPII